ncbi:MAG: hypothetical protein J6V40_03465, partial [Clostridia bacterium]|nr:hypothetical protein [Clostridia bacterium]
KNVDGTAYDYTKLNLNHVENVSSIYVSNIYTDNPTVITVHKSQNIYSSSWSTNVWVGIGLTDENLPSDDYIFPELESQIIGQTIYVDSIEDLLLMNTYTSGTFVLIDDVDLSGVEWVPLCSDTNPFTGTLKSQDGYFFTIRGLRIYNGFGAVGLISAIQGAKLYNFNLTVDYIGLANSSIGSSSVGAIYGKGTVKGNSAYNFVENINVLYTDVLSGVDRFNIEVPDGATVAYLGGAMGHTDRTVLQNVNVQGMKMSFKGQPDGDEEDSLFIGGVAGFITLVNESEVVEDVIGGSDVTHNTGITKNVYSFKNNMDIDIVFTSGKLADMGVGGLFGGVDIYSTGVYRMQEVLSSNNTIDVVIATYHNVNTVFTNNINIAGAMGIVYGSAGNKRDTLITVDNVSVVNTDIIFTDGSSTNNDLNAVLAYNATQSFDVFGNINVAGAVGQVGFESRFKIDINNIYVDSAVNVSSTTIIKESQAASVGVLLGRTSTNTVSGAIGMLYYNTEFANEGVDDNELNVYTMANVAWNVYEEEESPYNITYVVGGAIAKSVYSRVNAVYFDGTISGNEDNVVSDSSSSKLYFGGFIGYVNGSQVSNTIADGDARLYLDSVSTVGNFEAYVGSYAGFVLNNSITNDVYSIDNSTSNVNVLVQNKSDSIKAYFGGFVGGIYSNERINTVTNKIENSYSTGNFEISTDIDSTIGNALAGYESYYAYVGGFVGYAKGNVDVRDVYTINNFVLSSKATYDDEYKGGIVGYLDTRLAGFGTSAYYLIEFFPFGNDYGRGLSVSEMLYNSATAFASFDATVWTVNNNAFPVLNWINDLDVCDIVSDNLYNIHYMDCFFSDSSTDTDTIESLANVNFKKCFGYNVNVNTNNSITDADDFATRNALEYINFTNATTEASTRAYIAGLGIDIADLQKVGSRQNPELITDGDSHIENKSVIYTSTTISGSLYDVKNSTVYVRNTIDTHATVTNWINHLDKYSRLYGLNVSNVSNQATIIHTNDGFVSTTTLNGVDYTYIGTNNGRDFFNNIKSTGTSSNKYVYQANNGLVLYANISVANSNLIQSYGNNSSLVLSVAYVGNVADIFTVIDSTGHILNSYFVYNSNNEMTDGSQKYAYFGQNGTYNYRISTLASAQNIANYIDEYDFSKYWVMFTIDNSLTPDQRVAREQGVAMFRWHLKLNINKTWYFEDLDIYSSTQKAYSEYSWKNYANTITSYSNSDFTISSGTFNVYTAEGLALVTNLINNDINNYGNYNIKLVNAINLVGKLWTPIGSTGSYSGSVEGNSVNNICVLTNANAGLFANVEAENNTIKDISLVSGYVASFSNDVLDVGGLIGRVTDENNFGSLTLIDINNSLSAVMAGYDYHNECAPEYYVGGIVGSTSASMQLYNVYNYADIYNVNLAETNNSYTAGIIANASIPNNSSKAVTITFGGDLREDTEFIETRVRNYGNVSRGYYVAGIIAYSNVDVKFETVTNYGYITGESQDESVVAGIIAVFERGKLTAKATNLNTYHVIRNEYINIEGGDIVGGIIGRTGANTEIDLREVYLYVYLSGGDFVGGLVGECHSSVVVLNDCYTARGNIGNTYNGLVTDESNVNNVTYVGSTVGAFFGYVDKVARFKIANSYTSFGDVQLIGFYNDSDYSAFELFNIYTINSSDTVATSITSETLRSALMTTALFDDWFELWTRIDGNNYSYPVLYFDSDYWEDMAESVNTNPNEIIITTPEQLSYIAYAVNYESFDFAGKTVKLGNNISLSGRIWTPIGYADAMGVKAFSGTFDFAGYRVTGITSVGMTPKEASATAKHHYSGLFGYTKNAVIKDAIIGSPTDKDAYVLSSDNYIGALVAYAEDTEIVGDVENYTTVIGGTDYIGGIVGYYKITSDITTEATFVNHGYLNNQEKLNPTDPKTNYEGGIFGYIETGANTYTFKSAMYCYNEEAIKNVDSYIAGIVGYVDGNLTITDFAHSCIDIDADGNYVAGIAAKVTGALAIDTVSNCGDIVARGDLGYVAGIVGYAGAVNFDVAKNTVCDCVCDACTNPANSCEVNNLASITANNASGYVAGIAGFVGDEADSVLNTVLNTGIISTSTTNPVDYVANIVGKLEGNVNIDVSIINTNAHPLYGRNYVASLFGYVGGNITYTIGIGATLDSVATTIMATGDYAAGMIGYVGGDMAIATANNLVIVESEGVDGYVGGIVGYVGGAITANTLLNNATITSMGGYVGGIVGNAVEGLNISVAVTNNSAVTATGEIGYVGGVAGYAGAVSIKEMTNNGVVTAVNVDNTSGYIAGLIGAIGNAQVTTGLIERAVN